MACIIKANTIVIYDVGVVNYATNSGVTIYDASVVFTMLASYFISQKYWVTTPATYLHNTGHGNDFPQCRWVLMKAQKARHQRT